MKLFIAGARAITQFDDNVKNKLLSICEKDYDVLIGDCSGVDSSVQKFFTDLGYNKITIFASNGKARNNIGNWQVENIPATGGGFEFYAQKDLAMANSADYGFMIWNGKSKGTLNNIINLLEQEKTCLVYLATNKQFFTIDTAEKLLQLLALCPESTTDIYRRLSKTKTPQLSQITMF
ncbi:MAG: hypothetical protein LBL34_03500 [Clostridiales bacterium]|jgi:hypothetical protein|nr:hypothetical protein [Clostridiales bacterium]